MDSLLLFTTLLSGFLAFAIPIGLAWKYCKKWDVSLKVAGLGAVFFVAVQVLHTPLVLLTQSSVYSVFQSSLGATGAMLVLAIYLGLLAAVFEEVGRYLVFSRFLKEKGVKPAIIFGVGWGGVEAVIFLGILATVNIFTLDAIFTTGVPQYVDGLVSSGQLPADQSQLVMDSLLAQKQQFDTMGPVLPFVGLWERIIAMAFHVCASVLVMISILDGKMRGLYLALVAHFLLDFVAVASTLVTKDAVVLEAMLSVFVACVIVLTVREFKRARLQEPVVF